jgi:predicted enzyme related to lactoylglutathione lyase
MAEFEIPSHGQICCRELRTHDLATALSFYSELFGWNLGQTKVTEIPYMEIVQDNTAVGGMMAMDENWGEMPSHWATYVAADDADAAAFRYRRSAHPVSAECPWSPIRPGLASPLFSSSSPSKPGVTLIVPGFL